MRNRFGDLDHLLFGYRQASNLLGGVYIHLKPSKKLLSPFVLLAFVEQNATHLREFSTDEDILRDSEMIHHVEFLMDNSNAHFESMLWIVCIE